MSTSPFKEIPLTQLRAELPKRKRQVQLGMYRIAATYYGKIVGFLVPMADVKPLEEGEWIDNQKTTEMSLTEFRSKLTTLWELLQTDLDCVYLTFHTRRAAAFVTPRLMNHLPIPTSEISSRLISKEFEHEQEVQEFSEEAAIQN
jgi:hypothetical protein